MTDGTREVCVSAGSHLMTKVMALRCSQTPLLGAYAAIGPVFDAALATLAPFRMAGTAATNLAHGPGDFQMHLVDALAAKQPANLAKSIV